MLGLADYVLVRSIAFISFFFFFLVLFPFGVAVVRYRANYAPKHIQLDGDVQPRAGAAVNSYFSMIRRVKRLEGWTGLYKGFMPTFITIVISAFIALLPGSPLALISGLNIWRRLAYNLCVSIFSLPVRVIINRAITTPYKLPWLNGVYSLRILLTATERRHPWLLLLAPGLLISEVLSVAYYILFMDPLRLAIFPVSMRRQSYPFPSLSIAHVSAYLGLALISATIICPLQVVFIRLSIQRNHAASGYASVVEEGDADANDATYSVTDEDVIELRDEGDPYVGFVDCIKRIISDEGYSTLFRAWWITFMSLINEPLVY